MMSRPSNSVPRAWRRKLPYRYAAIVMPFVLSIIMTFVVSGVSTWKSLGISAEALAVWPQAWGLSWLVAFPTLIAVLPVVRRVVSLVVEAPGR